MTEYGAGLGTPVDRELDPNHRHRSDAQRPTSGGRQASDARRLGRIDRGENAQEIVHALGA